MDRKKIKFKIKLVGNHWYPDIPHNFLTTPMFSKKTERYLDLINKHSGKQDEFSIELEEIGIILDGFNIIYFNEDDLFKFFTTDEDFYIRMLINNHEFAIHSDFYNLLDTYFAFNKYDEYYRLHLV